MPLTKLDDKVALIVIDLQKAFAGMATVHPTSEIIDRSAKLARAFRDHGLPVVLVNVTGTAPGRRDIGAPRFALPDDWTELVPELGQQPTDHLVSKQRVGAFIGTSLEPYLRQHKVTQVVLTGIATSAGVEATARSAHDYGYNVVLVADAMTDRDAEAHQYSVEKLFPRIGEVTNTEDVLAHLQRTQASVA